MNYLPIDTKIDKDIIKISTEFGYIIYYKLKYITYIDPFTKYDDNIPDFKTDLYLEFIKIEKEKDHKSQKEIQQLIKNKNIIPSSLDYDFAHLGFVYADGDPNNHRWMLNFFNKNNQNVFNLYFDDIDIKCPLTTTSWHDGIWHGRFLFNKNDIEKITMSTPNKITIIGKKNKNKKKPLDVPKETTHLRLRYNINENIWYVDLLNNDKEIDSLICKTILCDAPLKGAVLRAGSRPKVSCVIKIKDVSSIERTLNTIVIRG